MAASLRPLTTGELLDRTFSLYRQKFSLFFGIAALPQLALFVIMSSMGWVVYGSPRHVGPNAIVAGGLVFGLTYMICSLCAGAITHAATTFAVSALYLEEPITLSQSFSRARGRMLTVIGVTICFGVAFGFGCLLLLVPAIFVLAWYSLAIPTSVVENLGVTKAFDRSKTLSKGSGGRILGVYTLLLIVAVVGSMAIGFLLGLAVTPLKPFPTLQTTLMSAVGYLAGAAVAPVVTIAITLLYYDQRVRKEAFDLQHMMASLQTAPIGAAVAGVGGVS